MHTHVVCCICLFQVQIQGQQGQVLQVASPSQQELQALSAGAQLVQQGELTEEQHQQVLFITGFPRSCNSWKYFEIRKIFFQYWKSFGIDQGSWKVLEKIAMHCLWLLILLIPLK